MRATDELEVCAKLSRGIDGARLIDMDYWVGGPNPRFPTLTEEGIRAARLRQVRSPGDTVLGFSRSGNRAMVATNNVLSDGRRKVSVWVLSLKLEGTQWARRIELGSKRIIPTQPHLRFDRVRSRLDRAARREREQATQEREDELLRQAQASHDAEFRRVVDFIKSFTPRQRMYAKAQALRLYGGDLFAVAQEYVNEGADALVGDHLDSRCSYAGDELYPFGKGDTKWLPIRQSSRPLTQEQKEERVLLRAETLNRELKKIVNSTKETSK